jgi:hypothetical protein
MGALEVVHPADRVACEDAVVPWAAWVDAKRDEMARLAAELRSIQATSHERLGHDPIDRVDASPSIVPMLEAMLVAAMERIDAQAAAAHARTDAVVAEAVLRSEELQRSVDTTRAALRRELEGPAARREESPDRHASIESDPGPLEDWDALDVAFLDPRLDALGSVVDLRDPAHVHDAFWRDVLAEAPVRERLRRWVQGQPS